MPIARYLSHTHVVKDPDVPVPQWGLSDVGRTRVAALAASGALTDTQVIYSSTEVKAVETAAPLSKAIGCPHHQRAEMGENDRSATGFLPAAAFEAAADAFFAHPCRNRRRPFRTSQGQHLVCGAWGCGNIALLRFDGSSH